MVVRTFEVAKNVFLACDLSETDVPKAELMKSSGSLPSREVARSKKTVNRVR